jgi:hypothetical protein
MRVVVADNADKSGVRSTRLRMAAFARRVTHGQFSHPGTGVYELIPKYPNELTKDQQRTVESTIRAMWLSLFGQEVDEQPEVLEWPREFWRRSRELVGCRAAFQREERVMPEADGPLDPEPLMRVSEMSAILVALDQLGDLLQSEQTAFLSDPEADDPNEVLLGLASRMYRLLYAFLDRPSSWVPDTAALHLRPLVDARILSGWLIAKNDRALFEAYRSHGLGRLKLLREHIKEDLGDDPPENAREMLEQFDHRVNLEREDWTQPVNLSSRCRSEARPRSLSRAACFVRTLGSFTGVSQRNMAIAAGLKREYDLSYAPLSGANHGEWPTVRDVDMTICTEPLHRGHRVGKFGPASRTVRPEPVFAALGLARDGIGEVFGHYGRDVRQAFEPLENAIAAAVYEHDDDGRRKP